MLNRTATKPPTAPSSTREVSGLLHDRKGTLPQTIQDPSGNEGLEAGQSEAVLAWPMAISPLPCHQAAAPGLKDSKHAPSRRAAEPRAGGGSRGEWMHSGCIVDASGLTQSLSQPNVCTPLRSQSVPGLHIGGLHKVAGDSQQKNIISTLLSRQVSRSRCKAGAPPQDIEVPEHRAE